MLSWYSHRFGDAAQFNHARDQPVMLSEEKVALQQLCPVELALELL